MTSPSDNPAANPAGATNVATLGGGCFWCLEAVFRRIEGVEDVRPGYAGGDVPSPSYEQVCTGTTGHAEVVQVRFDPEKLKYRDLLEIFFATHDPTTMNRQGPDTGTQYRSIILWHDDDQKRAAEDLVADLEQSGTFDDPIVTQVVPLETFYPAEAYHHDYFARNSGAPYCQAVISPKLAKLRQTVARHLRRDAEA